MTTDELAEWIAEHGLDDSGPDGVTYIQTHISHVFLVADRVYKLRKPVRLPFLDFSTRAARNEDCLHEVQLNRRLAPDVYLGIVSLRVVDRALEVGDPNAEPLDPELEHAVLMRRLPEGRDALALLEAGNLELAQLERVAARLARFHDAVGLGRPAPWTPIEWRERVIEPIVQCVDTLSDSNLLESDRVARLRATVTDVEARLAAAIEARRAEGRAVDAHGDLHLDHVWFETDVSEPLLVDCLEFDAELRRIDRASEVAFLAMDLAYRDRDDLAEAFLSAYASESDDYGLFGVVDLFAAYRGLVRAKVAALAAGQSTVSDEQQAAARESALRHVSLAERLLAPRGGSEKDPRIIVLCGTVGSGKSSVARRIARQGGGVLISSDRLRKQLAGVELTDHGAQDVDGGLYAPAQKESIYRAMLDRAEFVVTSGRTAILDASFTRRVDRDRVREWAETRGVEAKLVEVRCDPEIARARLAARESRGDDASDAGPDFLPISIARFESPDEWPPDRLEVVRTDSGSDDSMSPEGAAP